MAPRRGWWSRNWLWAVPTGCLGLLMSCGCLGALLFFFVMKGASGEVLNQALTRVKQSPEVREALGEPISPEALGFQGSINSSTNGGTARFTIPIQGARARGLMRVNAFEKNDVWTFTQLQVDIPDRAPVNLLGGGAAPEAGPGDTARPQDSLPDVEPLPEDPGPKGKKGSHDVEL